MNEINHLVSELNKMLQKKKHLILSIDGRCGSGKTRLAQYLSERFENQYQCRIFHLDDYYLPLEKRCNDWENIPGGNMDFSRFLSDVLLPAKDGDIVEYRPYSCRTGLITGTTLVEPSPITIIEGSYSQHPLLASYYDMRIFLTCSKEIQKERLQKREGERYTAFETKWIPMEERYFQYFDIEKQCDLYLVNNEVFS